MLSLHQLRTFLEIAKTGSVREAADRLVVSQPAVSSALAALQRTIGTPVVERDGRGVRLTPAGTTLAAYGRRIFALLDEAVAQARAAGGEAALLVRLAVVTTAAEQLVPTLLAGFDARTPTASVDLHVANRDAVWDRLLHDEADLALGGRPPDGRFTTCAVRENTLIVIGAAQRERERDAAALARATWLVREAGSGTRSTTEALFESLGIAPKTTTVGSNGAILGCLRAGLGVSLLSRGAVARDLADGTVVEIPTAHTPLRRDWHLVARAGRSPTLGVQRFLEHVVETGAFRAV